MDGFHKVINKISAVGIAIFTFLCMASPVPVLAEGEEQTTGNSNENNLTWILNNPWAESKKSYSSTYPYVRIRYGLQNTSSLVTPESWVTSEADSTIYAVVYRVKDSNGNVSNEDNAWRTLIFKISDTADIQNTNSNNVRFDYSSDKLNWSNITNSVLNSSYKANVEGSKQIYYVNITSGSGTPFSYTGKYMPNDCPRITLNYGQNQNSILYLFSTGDFSYLPWNFSTSSGGMHFEDGYELSPENTSRYSQIYIVMDTNNDNSVSEEEVNYYNFTYNTNYDYSEINEGNNFDQTQFLNWIALQIANGNDDPGGGTGSGGGSGAVGGSVTVTIGDAQQQQQQYQTIEENAINVTITNENGVNQSNSQYFDQVINNNLGTTGNSFEQAIGTISGFTSVARSFAGLAGTVLAFLPSWVLALMAVMFSLLFVMVVFRLIHLFL